ncbi:MAG: glycosyltransferase family 39 protein, partial [Actinomycetota bacterium]|nr:glycosyltransferase family 39 protein [Actinomycetota bacterium]
MSVAERSETPADVSVVVPRERRWPWRLGIVALLAGAAALRVWGVGQGLPFAYNADENAHFVPGAIGLFGHGYNPHYFINPPAYTYVLHVVLGLWFGGRDGVSRTFTTDPTQVWVAARLTAGFFSTVAVGLLYLAGARLFGRAAGLLSAGVLAVAFLPVFYSHLALNDVVTLAPVALSLWGTAGIVRRGRVTDYVLAGVGLGLACATKYTGGIVLLPLLAAGVIRVVEDRDARARATGLLVVSAVLSLAAFVAANPYVILDFAAFRDGLTHQADASNAELGKLGLTQESGHLYYLWTLTWGLGWVPVLAALVGVGLLARAEPKLLLVLVPAPILYVLFMGTQARFFGRWMLPAFPVVCLLAGQAMARLAALASRGRLARLAPAIYAAVAVALLGQGIVMSLHSGQVLARADTRNLVRDWLVAHVPAGTRIVVEPVVPDAWASDIGRPYRGTRNGARWAKYATSRSNIANDGSIVAGPGRIVNIEDYERTLYPGLVDRYEQKGYCWVVTGSSQRGRAEAQPAKVPNALPYYRELERRSRLAYEATP